MITYFYSNQIFNDKIILHEEEAHHAIKVLRKNIGDEIIVVDGNGGYYKTTIVNNDINNCKLSIKEYETEHGKSDHYIHIAIVPPKSHDRSEWFIEKAVEIGINEISFIQSQYSERNNIKLDRIRKRMISSMKQSLKAYLPKLNDIIQFDEFINNNDNTYKYLGYLGAQPSALLQNIAIPSSDYCVLIGPEGDFSEIEAKIAQDRNFINISLGKSRLRTETAGMAACHILNIINSNDYK